MSGRVSSKGAIDNHQLALRLNRSHYHLERYSCNKQSRSALSQPVKDGFLGHKANFYERETKQSKKIAIHSVIDTTSSQKVLQSSYFIGKAYNRFCWKGVFMSPAYGWVMKANYLFAWLLLKVNFTGKYIRPLKIKTVVHNTLKLIPFFIDGAF